MATMSNADWAVLCRTDFRKYVSDTMPIAKKKSMITKLFGTGSSTKETMTDASFVGVGNFQTFTGTALTDEMFEEYSKTIEFPERMKTIDIRKKLWEDQQKKVFNIAEQFSIAVYRTKEELCSGILNNAWSAATDDLWGDSKALCASDHPSKADDAYTCSNTMATALGPGAVETMRRQMAELTDGRGKYVEAELTTLVYPLALEETAWEILNSKGKVDTDENNANFHYGRYEGACWKYLTGDTTTPANSHWFGLDRSRSKMNAEYVTRVGFEMEDEYTARTATLSFTGRYRDGFMVSGWRWIVGSNP